MNDLEVVKDDNYYAREIRASIENLHRIIREATVTGLKITVNFQGLGSVAYAYQDAAEIVRKL